MSLKQDAERRSTRSLSTIVGGVVISVATMGATSVPASADILANSFNVNPQVTAAGPIQLDLNGGAGGVQDLAFAAPAATRVAISFDAECAVGGANFVTQANVTILLDAAPPGGGFAPIQPTTGLDDAFCSSNGTAALDGRVNPSRTVVTRVPAGVNTVRVTLQNVFGAGPSWIDDLAIDVENSTPGSLRPRAEAGCASLVCPASVWGHPALLLGLRRCHLGKTVMPASTARPEAIRNGTRRRIAPARTAS